MKARSTLTIPDLVVLSMLVQEPQHGYQLVQTLWAHDVKDWAGISRPQVYYSLNKLHRSRFIRVATSDGSEGPERRVFAITESGRAALAAALDRESWATQRPPPPFITWLVLSVHADKKTVERVFRRRRAFLEAELAREKQTLALIRGSPSPDARIGLAIVGLAIRQFELELAWLDEAQKALTG